MNVLNHIRRRALLLVSMLVLSASIPLAVATEARADAGGLPAVTGQVAVEPSSRTVAGTGTSSSAVSTDSAGTQAGDQQPGDQAAGDQAAGDQASSGQASSDQASSGQTAGDQQRGDQWPGVQQPGDQASGAGPPSAGTPPGQDAPPTAAQQSNTSTQTIGQVQSLGCTVHCAGTNQTQSADQQNTTAEQLAPGSDPPSGAPAGNSAANVTQLQLGCVAHCFGTTTISSDPKRAGQTIGRLLSSTAVPTLPTQNPVAANEENVVDQGSFQSQQGDGHVASQSQGATQSNATEQTGQPITLSAPASPDPSLGGSSPAESAVDTSLGTAQPTGSVGWADPAPFLSQLNAALRSVLSSLTDLFPALGSPHGSTVGSASVSSDPTTAPTDPTGSPTDPTSSSTDPSNSPTAPSNSPTAPRSQVVTQAEQGIWQIQIGCLMFCLGTQQSQQAVQSDTTTLLTSTLSVSDGTGSAAVSTYQLIWQLQVGCLLWCYDAVETQTASGTSNVLTEPPPEPSPSASQPSPTPAGADTGSSSPPANTSQALIGGPSTTVSMVGPPPQRTILGEPLRITGVTTEPILVPLPIALPRHVPDQSVFDAIQSTPDGTSPPNQGFEVQTAIGSSLRPGPASRAVSHRVTHAIKRLRSLARASRSSSTAREGIAPPPSDDTGLFLIGLAALLVALVAADVAWSRRQRSATTRS